MSSLDVYMKESGEIVARLGFMSEEYSWFRCRYYRYYRYWIHKLFCDTVTSIVSPCQVLVAAEHGPSHRGRGQEEGGLHLAEARQPVTSTDLM